MTIRIVLIMIPSVRDPERKLRCPVANFFGYCDIIKLIDAIPIKSLFGNDIASRVSYRYKKETFVILGIMRMIRSVVITTM